MPNLSPQRTRPNSSADSTSRGPERLRYALPSIAYTRPCCTARNDCQAGCCCRSATALIVRSIVYPQGARTRTSGFSACSSSQLSHGECSPTSPKTFSPPAYATSSGAQLPDPINGSSHSKIVTRGFLPKVAVIAPNWLNLFL